MLSVLLHSGLNLCAKLVAHLNVLIETVLKNDVETLVNLIEKLIAWLLSRVDREEIACTLLLTELFEPPVHRVFVLIKSDKAIR